jgi:hypothetical protein
MVQGSPAAVRLVVADWSYVEATTADGEVMFFKTALQNKWGL